MPLTTPGKSSTNFDGAGLLCLHRPIANAAPTVCGDGVFGYLELKPEGSGTGFNYAYLINECLRVIEKQAVLKKVR